MEAGPFELRRAVERLRDGLFDPVAVRLLTAREEQLRRVADRGLAAAEGRGANLCVVGPYGSGKSHSLTYIHDKALEAGYAVSLINLDPRETPFHDFRQVYRELYANLRFPDGTAGFAARWRAQGAGIPVPEDLPHLFRATLHAMLQSTLERSQWHTRVKLGARAFPSLLERALAGEHVPLQTLRGVLKLRQVPFFDEGTLRLDGYEPCLMMLRALGRLVQRLGFRGLVVLFDEGESIVQGRITQRSRGYAILDRFFRPGHPVPGLFSVFAFTEDFFRQLEAEDFGATQRRGEAERLVFACDYVKAWRRLDVYGLEELSSRDWGGLAAKLTRLHGQAYGWEPAEKQAQKELRARLEEMPGQQTRLKLKALVEELDVLHQERVFGGRTAPA